MHDVAVAAGRHELDGVDGPGVAYPLEVVAGEVDEHEVLGALLVVGEQLLGQPHVVLGGLAARPRPGDRMGDDTAAGDLDQGLRARADDVVGAAVGVRDAEEVHVRAGVGGPQRAVDVERRRRAGQREPLRDDDLERLPRPDRLLAPLDHVVELLLRMRAADVTGGRLDDRHGAVGRFGELSGHPVEAVDGVGPRPLDALVGGVVVDRVGDEEQGPVGVVEDGEIGREEHPDLREVQLVAAGVGDPFPTAHRVVGDRADHAADEGREAVDARRGQRLEGAFRASVGSPSVGTPTGGDPIQYASPFFSVSVARLCAPTMEYRDHTPPCSADSRRNVPGSSRASLR